MGSEDLFFRVGGERVQLTPLNTVRLVTPARGHHTADVGARLARSSRLGIEKAVPNELLVVRGEPDKLSMMSGYRDVEAVRNAFVDSAGHELILTDEVLISFETKMPKRRRRNICRRFDVSVVDDRTNLWNVRARDPDGDAPLHVANALSEVSGVKYAEPNALQAARFESVPGDPFFGNQWHLHNTGQNGGKSKADVRARKAWKITKGSPTIRVVVHDSGVDIDHPDLVANVDPGKDFDNGDVDASNDNGPHGTACAGVIAAATNSRGVTGIAPLCRIVPLRAAGSHTFQTWAETFEWAAENGDIISCSWSITPNNTLTAAIRKAAAQGRGGKGIPIFCATANGGHIPADYPANLPETIGVGASNNKDVRSGYSQVAPGIDFVAPSSGWPSADGATLRIETTDIVGQHGYNATGDYCRAGDRSGFGGTSSATPLAAGIAALMLSVNPKLSAGQVRRIMRRSCKKIDAANAGYDASGFSSDYGYGRLNAAKAVRIAKKKAR